MVDPKRDPYAVLRLANYRYFVLARSFFTLAMQMQTVAVSWDIYQRLHMNPGDAALALGLIGLVQVLPMLLLALPGGHAADRFDRKTILRSTQLLFAVCAMALLILSKHQGHVGLYYLVLGIAGCGRAFTAPAVTAFFPTLIPRDLLPNAMTWNSTIFQVTAMAGPAVGGLIVASWGPSTSYLVNILCSGLSFLTFSLTAPSAVRTERPPVTWDSLVSGVRFVFGTRLLLGLFCLDLFAVLLGGATALLPIFANTILHVGPSGYGLMRAAPSLGAIIMAVITAHLRPWRTAGRVMLFGVAGFGVATIVFGLSKLFWLSLVALALTGMCDNISVVVRQTVMQMITPDAMRGRVSAITFLFISCSNELGELESGLTARWFGAINSVVLGGIGTVLVVFGANVIFPEIGKLRRLHELKPVEIARATEQEIEEVTRG
ncbi:MAG: MFS transporter [Verrucomicrobiota bacterium]